MVSEKAVIKLSKPSLDSLESDLIQKVLDSNQLVQGKITLEFENLFSDYTGAKYSIAVSNCTAALQLSLISLGVSFNDIVIVPAYSWISTANVVSLCGAHPVFIDIDPKSFNMSPIELEKTLNSLFDLDETRKLCKAIIFVHTFGNLNNIAEVCSIAKKFSIPVVEDAACALGSQSNGKSAGNFGKIGCFSFHPRKIITTGEGGMLVTNDLSLSSEFKALRNHGMDPNSNRPNFISAGFNFRLTEIQSAIGISQMKKIESLLLSRKKIAKKYFKLLNGSDLLAPFYNNTDEHSFQSFVILIPLEIRSRRDEIIEYLKNQGIETTIGTYNMPRTTYFSKRYGYRIGDYPVTEDISERSISLPIYHGLTEGEQELIVSKLISLI